MKLYIYDHCPFCVRARMMFGLRKVAVEEITLLSDDEATPVQMIGAKLLPIVQLPNGEYMGESLDIVDWVNDYAGQTPLQAARPEIQAWFDGINQYCHRLMMPRDVQLGLAEFATPEATRYFIEKKEAQWEESFAEMMADTPKYLLKVQADMQKLLMLMRSSECLNGEEVSLEDVLVFPILRNLTMVKGLVFPEMILTYVQHMSEKSGVDVFFDRAV